MIVKVEMNLARDFQFWGSAAGYSFMSMTESQISEVEDVLDQLYPQGMCDMEINDTFAYDRDFLANCNGFDTWEEMMTFNDEN